jgi:nucleoside-diphosphate-sugar epimerase
MPNKNKSLIIGVNSFLGASLVKLLCDKSKVIGVYNVNSNNLNYNIENIRISEISNLADDFDTVYFVSSYIPSGNDINHAELFNVNIALLISCLNIFKSARFILASSVSVYGTNTSNISEDSSSVNVSAYGLSKLWAEQIIAKHHSFAIMRISSMYGVGMKRTTFLPLIIKNAIINNKIYLLGDGCRLQNYIHVDDVASSFIAASKPSINGIFLAVNEFSVSNINISEMIKKYLPSVEIKFKDSDVSQSSEYDAIYTYRTLNWKNRIDLKAEIKLLIEWIKKEY